MPNSGLDYEALDAELNCLLEEDRLREESRAGNVSDDGSVGAARIDSSGQPVSNLTAIPFDTRREDRQS